MQELSDEELDGLLVGKGSPRERAWFGTNLLRFLKCGQRYQEEYHAMRALGKAIDEANAALTIDRRQLGLAFDGLMARVREAEAVDPQIARSLNTLEAMLEPVLGRKAVQRAISSAARSPEAHSVRHIAREDWDGFLERLANTASILCGDVFAQVIREQRQMASVAR
jgi:hypothetical protein